MPAIMACADHRTFADTLIACLVHSEDVVLTMHFARPVCSCHLKNARTAVGKKSWNCIYSGSAATVTMLFLL